MILLNFTHPLTVQHLTQLTALLDESIADVREIPTQFDPQQPFVPQVRSLVDACGLSAFDWQTQPLLINPPALSYITAVLLAELHGRMGYFPPILRLRPVPTDGPQHYEVAEILTLQSLRDTARQKRNPAL